MTRIVFVDIDGVLNHPGTYADRHPGDSSVVPVDPACMARLNRLLAEAHASVVVSSSWRLFMSWEHLGPALAEVGLVGDVIGQTPSFLDDADLRSRALAGLSIDRGMEIAAWLVGHPDATSFVILDDDPNMGGLAMFLVQTDPVSGLSDADVARATRVLSSGRRAEPGDVTRLGEPTSAETLGATPQDGRDRLRL